MSVICGEMVAKLATNDDKKIYSTDYTATRMLGYLYRVSDPRIEDLVDEMLAILSDRDAIIRKKEMEHAQAVINEIYRNGL